MSYLDLLEALRSRAYPFNILKKHLNALGMSTGRGGWVNLIAKCKEDLLKKDEGERWSAAFRDVFENHIRFGSKAIFIYEVDKVLAEKISSNLHNFIDVSSPYIANFPLPLSKKDLTKSSSAPIAAHFENKSTNETRLFLCSKRVFREREEISLADFKFDKNESIRDSFAEFDVVYGVRCGIFQAFDCIVIRSDKDRLEIQIDLSRHLNVKEIKQIAAEYKEMLNNWAYEQFNLENWLDMPVNFLPMIEKLYHNPDGKVSSLGHSTGTSSIKDEKMRNKDYDLREEHFHKEGLKAIGTTESFAITKRWASENGDLSSPALTIPGNVSLLGHENVIIDYVIIDDCACQENFDMVLGKLF